MRSFWIVVSVIVSFFVLSCEKYEDGVPDRSVRAAFDTMYPKAMNVEWELENFYWKVSFDIVVGLKRTEHEAWYESDGTWVKTVTEMPWSSVPQIIKDYLASSIYGEDVIDDNEVEYIVTPTEKYYRIEILHGGIEVNVKVTEDGKVGIAGIDR